ncbi:PilZ domain-containing protein [Sphingomonas sp. CGMCC 1.13654]|uniref:PilZ domain-containing protein n=1 Tax=Sphingomonas chungangi TaxID=2683589 RepID=A0A838L6E2_9SPHN|nr:PilZ domain-containing protein [Sphingomonas chungangi]MBA2934500.1 PilZ domain-containing protein [Sphingomonas chungangi]
MTETDSLPNSEQPRPENQRIATRESIFLGADIMFEGEAIQGRIRNISSTGAYLEADAAFGAGDRITISFRGFADVGATVTRVACRGVGLRFDDRIDPARCKRLGSSPGAPQFELVRYAPAPIFIKRPPRQKQFGRRR